MRPSGYAMDSGSSVLSLSPSLGSCIVFLGKTTVPPSTKVCKWLLANSMLGQPCDVLASHRKEGGRGGVGVP